MLLIYALVRAGNHGLPALHGRSVPQDLQHLRRSIDAWRAEAIESMWVSSAPLSVSTAHAASLQRHRADAPHPACPRGPLTAKQSPKAAEQPEGLTETGLTQSSKLSSSSSFFLVMRCPKSTRVRGTRSGMQGSQVSFHLVAFTLPCRFRCPSRDSTASPSRLMLCTQPQVSVEHWFAASTVCKVLTDSDAPPGTPLHCIHA